MYFACYDPETKLVLSYRPLEITYPEKSLYPFIQITEEQRQIAYDSSKIAKVIDGKLILEEASIAGEDEGIVQESSESPGLLDQFLGLFKSE